MRLDGCWPIFCSVSVRRYWLSAFVIRFHILSYDDFVIILPSCFVNKYKVLQEKISLGVINRISCDACNLSFQAKSFEIQNHCLFFIYIFRGDCEIAEGNQSPEDIREGEFVFYEALQKITIKSDKRVDFILALLSEPYVLTHTKHDPELYCGRIFKSKSAANKLFSSVLTTTFKSLPSSR